MFRGMYTATSGMMASERKQHYLTNNLSNAQTPGFKQDQAVIRSFPEYLLKERNTDSLKSNKQVGELSHGVYTQEGVPLFSSGTLKETGNNTDFALLDDSLPIDEETGQKGISLIGVRADDDTIRYTRNGNFTLSDDGFLTTSEGYRVLNANLEPIQLSSEQFTLKGSNLIEANGNEQELWVGYTGNPEGLTQLGNGVFEWSGDENNAPRDIRTTEFNQFTVEQGFLEGSNVDLTTTMTDMLNTYRMYEANQRVLQTYDQSIDKSVNDIGRVY
ncbi:flagellar hook-basal body protein [Alkalihalobacillus sp. CinArs1]|uniref:flagellar hook-basal body protein n=1 Tax=Alkalihalobacillus sp. CinArs1 TaxID=2995314 RepID=UPI0022DE286D|nr:flagellar hook-basal body protein [Alkalihalobacillus sp. CinArs1]